ncbi:glycosyltransferase [Methylorubrum extorquens]|uniref:glycosyltransferase n=1 Tax=Methylorubrum extorquens TaxID=408 RepID=UPI001EE5AA28|nr:glycosyltransferase [Methylorubrum extorquens]MCG5247834.1 glycosyltransferase [Methylorubrum extorquens]
MRASALVTTYNHSRFIAESIESLLAQESVIPEIIVVDDGSSDDTVSKARSFERFGVKVISKPNTGVSHSLNLAIRQSIGDVLILQSGDDVSSADRIDRQLDLFASSNNDIIFSLPRIIDECSHLQPDVLRDSFFRKIDISNGTDLFRSLFYDGNFLCAPSAALKRHVFTDIGGFHEGLLQLQDFDFWLRAVARGYRFAMLPQRIVDYRVHANNLSSSRHSIRSTREFAAVLRAVPQYASSDLIARVLYGDELGPSHSKACVEILAALLFLRHGFYDVKQAGFEAFIQAMNDPVTCRCLEFEFNLKRSAVFDLLDSSL